MNPWVLALSIVCCCVATMHVCDMCSVSTLCVKWTWHVAPPPPLNASCVVLYKWANPVQLSTHRLLGNGVGTWCIVECAYTCWCMFLHRVCCACVVLLCVITIFDCMCTEVCLCSYVIWSCAHTHFRCFMCARDARRASAFRTTQHGVRRASRVNWFTSMCCHKLVRFHGYSWYDVVPCNNIFGCYSDYLYVHWCSYWHAPYWCYSHLFFASSFLLTMLLDALTSRHPTLLHVRVAVPNRVRYPYTDSTNNLLLLRISMCIWCGCHRLLQTPTICSSRVLCIMTTTTTTTTITMPTMTSTTTCCKHGYRIVARTRRRRWCTISSVTTI